MIDHFEEALMNVPEYILKCPVCFQWVKFKGETMFAGLNYERSLSAGKPMIDLYYCATQALNGRVLKTVQYDKNKFVTSSPKE